jgi:hypothetical protein
LEIEQIFAGEFKVGSGTQFSQLIPLDVWASMKVTLPFSQYSEKCETPYGERGETHGRHSVYEVFHTADVLEWFGGTIGEDDEIVMYIDPPEDLWEVWNYTYFQSYNTIPGLVAGIGSRSTTSDYYITGLSSYSDGAILANGQTVEEYGPIYMTDNDGFTFVVEHSKRTITLQCIENCQNLDCSQLCYDGKECTDDTCIPGEGCTFEPLEGSCSDNLCYEDGYCSAGECIQEVPEDCDDDNPCTKDDCIPLYGCIHDADNKKLRNEDPHDCWQTICLGSFETLVPDPNETPIQGPDNDCLREICVAGYGEITVGTDLETPPQGSPADCLREICLTTGDIISVSTGSEPNCPCTRDWECEDGNFCTRESCDQTTNTCIFHGPDDSLIPPEIPANCNEEICQGGNVVLIPDSDDRPVDLDPYDCLEQYCDNGQINTAPDPEENISCTE